MNISKRKKFVATSIILSLGFLGINFLRDQNRLWVVGILTVITILLFVWSLYEGLALNTTILTLILPPLFTLGVGFFWFLLPETVFARLPIVVLYGMGIYALCGTENSLMVSYYRKIALARAARGFGFLLTLLVSFLLFDTIFSLKAPLIQNVITAAGISFFLFLQGLWTSRLEPDIFKGRTFTYSVIFSVFVGEMVALLYFWPVSVVVGSLFMTVCIYVLLGLGQAQLESRLFKQTAQEYLLVGLFVFLTVILVTRWGV